jgi:hypothetical protein
VHRAGSNAFVEIIAARWLNAWQPEQEFLTLNLGR